MMLKRISLMISIVFFLLSTNVYAHSYLKDSNPKTGEIVTEALENVTLTFETKVETASTLSLKDQNGSNIPLSQVSVNNNQLIGTLKDELTNGGYTIHWKIIGADGHPLEGDISFSVQLPESRGADETLTASANNTLNSDDTSAEKESVKDSENNLKETAAELTQETKQEETSFKDYALPLVVGLLIIIGAGSYWIFFRKKNA